MKTIPNVSDSHLCLHSMGAVVHAAIARFYEEVDKCAIRAGDVSVHDPKYYDPLKPMPCGGTVTRVMIDTPLGAIAAVVCVRCGEGYGHYTLNDETYDAHDAMIPKLDRNCDGSPFTHAVEPANFEKTIADTLARAIEENDRTPGMVRILPSERDA